MRSRIARTHASQPSLRRFLLRRVNDAVFKVMHCIALNARYFSVYGDPRVYPRATERIFFEIVSLRSLPLSLSLFEFTEKNISFSSLLPTSTISFE